MSNPTTPQPTSATAATPAASHNPFKKALSYLQGQADTAAKDRWEGSSYLTSRGKEPQQRYRSKSKEERRRGSEQKQKQEGQA